MHLSLADGLAAVVGDRYGKKNKYKVLKETKSVAGTLTFWIVSTIIVAGVFMFGPVEFSGFAWPLLLWLPVAAAALENVSPRGADNLIVPFAVMLALNWLDSISLAFTVTG